MNHDEAIQMEATECYLLDELEEDKRDAFEEHYFDCAVCASDVKAAFALRDAVWSEGLPKEAKVIVKPERFGRQWLTASLAAAASIIVTFFATWTPMQMQLAASRTPATPQLAFLSQTRGEEERTPFDRRSPIVFAVRLEPDEEAPQYTWEIIDATGKVRKTQTVDNNQVQELTLPVVVPARSLEPGKYRLRVISKRDHPYPFTVQ